MREQFKVTKPQIQQIRDSVDIVEIISEYVQLKKSGVNYKGLCPFHREKTPSFMVSRPKQIYHCFGCGVGGNVFDFLMRVENMNFKEALVKTAARAGIEIKVSPDDGQDNQREIFYGLNGYAMEFYHRNLLEGSAAVRAKNYLKERGITRKEAIDFRLGYSPDSWDGLTMFLKSKSLNLTDAARAGLLVEKKTKGSYYDRYRNRLMFPIFNMDKRVIAFGARTLTDESPKYLNSPESLVFLKRKSFYGLDSETGRKIRDKGSAIIVEGYMDMISLRRYGFLNSLATLGTAFTLDHARLLKRFTENIYVTFDSDDAGINAVKRTLRPVLVAGLNAKVIALPRPYDPDSYLREFGKEGFFKIMRGAREILEFYIKNYFEKESNIVGRTRVLEEIAEILSEIPNVLMRELVSKKVAEMTGIREAVIGGSDLRKVYPKSRGREDEFASEELMLVKLFTENPDFTESVKKEGVLDCFCPGSLKEFAQKLISEGSLKGQGAISGILDELKNEGLKRALYKVLVKESAMDQQESSKALHNCIERIKKNHFRRKSVELQQELIAAERAGDEGKFKEILEKKKALVEGKHFRKTRGL